MINDRSQPDFEEELLARFLQELEAAPERAVVVKSYAHRHPAMAEELARLEEMNRLVARAGSDEAGSDFPLQLGEFRIIRRIARGGMGDIYEAVQDRLNRRVTVKTIRRGRISQHARGRFFREQRVLARLHQTHIVPIHTAGEESDLLYFVMPFIDGAPLHQVVRAAAALDTKGPASKTPSLTALADRAAHHVSVKETTKPARPRKLSAEYFRSAARVMADAAEAVEHAHHMNILHRDLKPSNILLDRQGQCWIIDFGLAGYVGQLRSGNDDTWLGDGEALTVGGIVGTPQYMSPEQWRGEPADARSDVWGLGATLYELLTLRRAFDAPTDLEAQERVLNTEPTPPESIISDVPADLAAVCHKALQKDETRRYPTAQAFADDLRRWLRREPVSARRAPMLRRAGLWAQRNPGWAVALFGLMFAGITIGFAALERGRRRAVESRADMQKIHQHRRSLEAGWRSKAMGVAETINSIQSGDDLRDEVAALLTGMDATPALAFPISGSALTFDRRGERLLIGGLDDRLGAPRTPARLLRLDTRTVTATSAIPGAGPVVIRGDGTACHLAMKDPQTIVLWDLDHQKPISSFTLDRKAKTGSGAKSIVLALSGDGSKCAASWPQGDDRAATIVWDGLNGKQLYRWDWYATSLALTPDGSMLATGQENGRINVYSLADGETTAQFDSGGMAITALAFGRDPVRLDHQHSEWRLASGDAGTRTTVWDLYTGQHRCHCDGVMYGVPMLAFSPDGMILLTAGRKLGLWDAATGQLIFEIAHQDLEAICFDPSGQRVAASHVPINANLEGKCHSGLWDISYGDGTTMLRGLFGPVGKAVFSPDGNYVAALSHQWQVGLWNLKTRQLLYVFDGPHGDFVDNAALVFDAAGQRLACAGGSRMKMWDVSSGQLLNSWDLYVGLQDALAFDANGKSLWSVRCETRTHVPPYSNADIKTDPPFYPIRDLFSSEPTEVKAEIEPPDDYVNRIVLSPDGATVVINGRYVDDGQRRDRVRAFRMRDRSLLWTKPARSGTLLIDPCGKFVGVDLGTEGQHRVEIQTCKVLGESDGCIHPALTWRLSGKRLKIGNPVIADLSIDRQMVDAGEFSPCGRFLAINRRDGTVLVYNLEEFRSHLSKFQKP